MIKKWLTKHAGGSRGPPGFRSSTVSAVPAVPTAPTRISTSRTVTPSISGIEEGPILDEPFYSPLRRIKPKRLLKKENLGDLMDKLGIHGSGSLDDKKTGALISAITQGFVEWD